MPACVRTSTQAYVPCGQEYAGMCTCLCMLAMKGMHATAPTRQPMVQGAPNMCKHKYAGVRSMWARIRQHEYMPACADNDGYACDCTDSVAYGTGCIEHIQE